MNKYDLLFKYVANQNKDELLLTYAQIKDILSFEIDHSFLKYKKELLDYGYCVDKISLKNKTVLFKKTK